MQSGLFVYGTLAPGQVNHHVLAPLAGHWQPATLKGYLHEDGWGAEPVCPGIVPSEDGDPVAGYLLTADGLESWWSKLDEFEGAQYQRISVTVQLENGDLKDAFVYALRR